MCGKNNRFRNNSVVWSYMISVVRFLREHVNLSFLWIFTYLAAREMLIYYWQTKAAAKCDTISMAPEVWTPQRLSGHRVTRKPNLLCLSREIYRLFMYVHSDGDLCVVQNITLSHYITKSHVSATILSSPLLFWSRYFVKSNPLGL